MASVKTKAESPSPADWQQAGERRQIAEADQPEDRNDDGQRLRQVCFLHLPAPREGFRAGGFCHRGRPGESEPFGRPNARRQ